MVSRNGVSVWQKAITKASFTKTEQITLPRLGKPVAVNTAQTQGRTFAAAHLVMWLPPPASPALLLSGATANRLGRSSTPLPHRIHQNQTGPSSQPGIYCSLYFRRQPGDDRARRTY